MIGQALTGAGIVALLTYLAVTSGQRHNNSTNMTKPNSFTAMSRARDYSQNNFLDKTDPYTLATTKTNQFSRPYLLDNDAYMDNAMRGFYDKALVDSSYPFKPNLEAFKNAGKFYRGVDTSTTDLVMPYARPLHAIGNTPSSRLRLNIDSQNLEQTYKDMLALSTYINTIQQYGSENQQRHVNSIIDPSFFGDYPSEPIQNEIIDFFNQNKEAIANNDLGVFKKLLPDTEYPRFVADAPTRYKVPSEIPTSGIEANRAGSVMIPSASDKLPKPENKPVTTHGKRLLDSRIRPAK